MAEGKEENGTLPNGAEGADVGGVEAERHQDEVNLVCCYANAEAHPPNGCSWQAFSTYDGPRVPDCQLSSRERRRRDCIFVHVFN